MSLTISFSCDFHICMQIRYFLKDNYSVLKCVISEIISSAFIFIIELPLCFYRDATRDSVSHVVTIDDQRTKTDTTD